MYYDWLYLSFCLLDVGQFFLSILVSVVVYVSHLNIQVCPNALSWSFYHSVLSLSEVFRSVILSLWMILRSVNLAVLYQNRSLFHFSSSVCPKHVLIFPKCIPFPNFSYFFWGYHHLSRFRMLDLSLIPHFISLYWVLNQLWNFVSTSTQSLMYFIFFTLKWLLS